MATTELRLCAVARADRTGQMRCSRCHSRVIMIHGEPWCPAHGEVYLGERPAFIDEPGPGDQAA